MFWGSLWPDGSELARVPQEIDLEVGMSTKTIKEFPKSRGFEAIEVDSNDKEVLKVADEGQEITHVLDAYEGPRVETSTPATIISNGPSSTFFEVSHLLPFLQLKLHLFISLSTNQRSLLPPRTSMENSVSNQFSSSTSLLSGL